MANPALELNALNDLLDSLTRSLVEGLQSATKRAIANKTDPQAILDNLRQQLENKTGTITSLINAIGKTPTKTIRQIFTETQAQTTAGQLLGQAAEEVLPPTQRYSVQYNDDGTTTYKFKPAPPAEKLAQAEGQREAVRLMWVAIFVNTCPNCISLSGSVRTLSEWKASGYWPGNGATVCDANCKCSLVPVDTMRARFGGETEAQIQKRLENGIQLQKKKIDELEQVRGEKYAESTYTAMIGRVRDSFFNPSFEEREPLFIKSVPNKLPKAFEENVKKVYDLS